MQTIAILEPDGIIALDIATTVEHAKLATTEIFRSTEEALRRVRPSSHSLLIIDIGDDQQREIETAIEMRRTHGVRCLIFSDHTVSKSLPKLREAEPLGFLVKPFSSQELLAVVESALYRARMEEQLRTSERRYRNLFQYSLSARCVVDGDGLIQERNSVFERSVPSAKLGDVRGLFASDFDWGQALERVRRGEILQLELQTNNFGAGPRDVICSVSLLAQSLEKLQVALEMVDITELKRTREELFQSQKQEEIGRITSGVAHDLNNFLTSMTGNLEIMKLDIPENSSAREDIEGIEKAIQKTSALTKQLLGFSRKKSFEPKIVDLREVLADSMKMLKRLIPENIALTLALIGEPVFVVVDVAHLDQVLLNLVVNARDALAHSDDPRIEISLAALAGHSSSRDRRAAARSPSRARISVSDNGCGIEESVRERIFEPFFTTKEAGKGTGLGLSIVKSLAEMNGGHLSVESEVGKGTTFHLEFPIQGESGASELTAVRSTARELKDHSESAPLMGARILVVDDDPSVLETCGKVLRRAGAEVRLAERGFEALSACAAEKFDLLLSDIVLPKMTGMELWEQVQRESRIDRCLFMTGYEPGAAAERFSDIEVLHKPFNPAALVDACARAALPRGRRTT